MIPGLHCGKSVDLSLEKNQDTTMGTKMGIIFVILSLLLLTGCGFFQGSKEEGAIARVGDKILYYDDIKGVVPSGAAPSDSLTAVNNYIQNWIKQQAVLQKAEANLPPHQLDVEQKLENYRRSLIVHQYKTALIRQNLDTIVSDAQIQDYYDKHKNNFTLRDNIVRILYVKLPRDAPNQRQLRAYMQSDNPDDRRKLKEFCERYAVNYYLDDNSWLFFNDLLKEIPIETYHQENYLRNHRYVVEEDSLYSYHVMIKGFRIKESTSPLSFERDRIYDMIVNQRKMELIREMEKAVVREAYKNNLVNRFDRAPD